MSAVLSFFVPCSAMSGKSDTDDPDSGVFIFCFLLLFFHKLPVFLKVKLPFFYWVLPEKVVIK